MYGRLLKFSIDRSIRASPAQPNAEIPGLGHERTLGVEGIQKIVCQASSLPAEEMKQGILDGVAAWRDGPPTDDVSLMLVHVR